MVGPLDDNYDLFEPTPITRSATSKLMQLKSIAYRSKNDMLDEIGNALFSSENPIDSCADLLVHVEGKPTNYVRLDKLLALLISEIQEHYKILEDHKIRLEIQQEEADQLIRDYENLKQLVSYLKLLIDIQTILFS